MLLMGNCAFFVFFYDTSSKKSFLKENVKEREELREQLSICSSSVFIGCEGNSACDEQTAAKFLPLSEPKGSNCLSDFKWLLAVHVVLNLCRQEQDGS